MRVRSPYFSIFAFSMDWHSRFSPRLAMPEWSRLMRATREPAALNVRIGGNLPVCFGARRREGGRSLKGAD